MEVRVINSWYLIDVLRSIDINNRLAILLYHYLRREKSKVIKLFTNRVHYEIFKQLWNKPLAIYVSRNYVVLHFQGIGRSHFYVIGINTDKRLFINKIRDFDNYGARIICEYHDDNDYNIPIYLVEDKDIFRAMDFEEDIENSEEKVIPKYRKDGDREQMIRNYRIQGDLILRVTTEDVFFGNIRQLVIEQVDQILNRVILLRIQNVLADIGISSQIIRRFNREALMFRAFPRNTSIEEEEYYLENLTEILKRKLNISDIAERIKFTISYDFDSDTIGIAINFFNDRAEFGQRFEPTIIRALISWETLHKFADKIMSQLKLEPQDNIISRGRHLIRYHGYPSRFTILAKLPGANGVEEEYIIPINLDLLHIMKGKMYLYHPEHGHLTIGIAQNLTAEINSIPLDDDFEERLNYIAIKSLPDSRQLSLL
jgi:GTPase SAR1 family protein